MKKILIATSNKSKIAEIKKMAADYNLEIIDPSHFNINLKVDENGKTFKENAFKKASAYFNKLKNPDIWYVGDDSGIEIKTLNNKPGPLTRRWAGYEMTDEEIRRYALKLLKGKENREATFKTVLSLVGDGVIEYFEGTMDGEILTKENGENTEGFPFGSLFKIKGLDIMISEFHKLPRDKQMGFKTHREIALSKLFKFLQKKE